MGSNIYLSFQLVTNVLMKLTYLKVIAGSVFYQFY